MSFLFTLDEDKLSEQLPGLFERYEKHVADAEPIFKLEGVRLELVARNLPHHQVFYDQRAQEMKQLVKWLENLKAKLEARFTKNYSQGQRALGVREVAVFINGEKDIVEINQLIIEAALLHQQLSSIVTALEQMGWMVGNMVKLRVAEMQDAII